MNTLMRAESEINPTEVSSEFFLENFVPHYQPIINIASGCIAGYESLARFWHKEQGVVSAGKFFLNDTIDSSDKLAIDRHLRKLAIEYFAQCNSSGFLSLNISPDWVNLLDTNYYTPTMEMIRAMGLNPQRVVIEFTEASGDLEKLRSLAKLYRQAGLKIAVDDFGVGGSQVDRIIATQPDFIKLDMHLFKSASRGGPEADVVLSLASIAQRAGSEIICEGVETEDEFHFALECGADYIQGWLFQQAQPLVANKFRFIEQINSYKQSYLKRKSERHYEMALHNTAVASAVGHLCESFRNKEIGPRELDELDSSALHKLGILRFYICDSGGNQLSPNFEIGPFALSVESKGVGHNLSHRPYFPLLHAMDAMEPGHLVVSKPYKDVLSNRICKTYGTFISADKVLLVDVNTNDEVLFHVLDNC